MSRPQSTQDNSGAVLLCEHVANGLLPILRGRRDKPLTPEDSGWQFRCNVAAIEAMNQVKVWSLTELLESDDSLRSIIEEPYGTIVERQSATSPWVVSRFDLDADE